MYKAAIDKASYATHNIVCDNSIVGNFSLVSELDLSRCNLQSDHLIEIATACPYLQRLNLQVNQQCLSIGGLQMFAKNVVI